MGQAIYQGRTNNHVTWVMVDATDFATPESALSAATKIKVYGHLRSATGTNFVTSGTGSLTNDITHVGASVLGLYQIALAKADISDASAAFYDQYVISLSATGAAYQALILDGIRDDGSYVSNVLSYLSNMVSTLSGVVSDIRSGTSDTNSKLVVMSDILSGAYSAASDIRSLLIAGTFALGASNLSDIESRVWSADKSDYTASSQMGSLLNAAGAGADAATIAAKVWSDYQSKVGQTPSQVFSNTSNYLSYISAIVSGIGAGQSASAIADKVWSDFGSKAGATPSQVYSVLLLAGSRVSDVQSYLAVMSGILSDAYSGISELQSRVTTGVATASDVASKVWAEKYTAASNVKASTFGSALRLNLSRISDTQSYLVAMSGMLSDTHSAAAAATAPTASAVAAKVWSDFQSQVGRSVSDAFSELIALSDAVSNVDADLANLSNIVSGLNASFGSRVPKRVATDSQLSDIHSDLRSYLAGISSIASDAHSAALVAASAASDAYSALTSNRAEPAQGAPAATTTMLAKLDYLYKAFRNRTTQTATQYSLYADDAVTVDQKATFSDDGTTADRGEIAAGP